eukprot:CAMPEP_0206325466 /NCGR_PEP_ID=MMETSP0106_2-20121207/21091_1 /ASSEMBLY_ACC=CAM_ASM_000206 /TAXON_ID=81532 /ORGANISM="Acanthoeca-like sp., Strain 10tr" /LENGTH=274 /DNA_ID=CAMNT_0053757941 /DNA_START=30 /DNA_END=855 /DNA_ORIENTATION=+
MKSLNVTLQIDESIGLSPPWPTSWTVTELYPRNGTIVGQWEHGVSVVLEIGGSDARVLSVSPSKRGELEDSTVVEGLQVLDAVDVGGTLALKGASGPAGNRVNAVVRGAAQISTISVNDVRCNGSVKAGDIAVNVAFGGPAVQHAMPTARKKAYPIPWDAADFKATWLVPERLLMNVFLEKPSDAMKVSLSIDGVTQGLVPAYNSRGLVRSRCFLGWYLDATQFTQDDKVHHLELTFPKLAYPGQFQGVFWGNVETIYTDDVTSCSVHQEGLAL